MARLYLNRQRVYEKECEGQFIDESERDACRTTAWSEWSDCDRACGQGKRYRQRQYKNPSAAINANCREPLTSKEICFGPCDGDDIAIYAEHNPDAPDDPDCQLTPWSEWSPCSVSCGSGVQIRSRRYKNTKVAKKCKKGIPNPPQLQETQICVNKRECGGYTATTSSPDRVPSEWKPRCKMSNWSDWSPCSATCGMGYMIRNRYPLHLADQAEKFRNVVADRYISRVKSHQREREDGEEHEEEPEDEEDDDEEEEIILKKFPLKIEDPSDPCHGWMIHEEKPCGFHQPTCDDSSQREAPSFCFTEPRQGSCRNMSMRWYYDPDKNDCALFPYMGCGNKFGKQTENNFLSQLDCLTTCTRSSNIASGSLVREQTKTDPAEKHHHQHHQSHRHKSTNEEKGSEIIHCRVSKWHRAPCNVTCGDGYRLKSRRVVTRPRNGGKLCPKLRKIEKCSVRCDSSNDLNPTWGSTQKVHNDMTGYLCKDSNWSEWSACSKTCGVDGVQIRIRYVIDPFDPNDCSEQVEERQCENVPRCQDG